MDHLWSPWRYTYVSSAAPDGECLFCRIASESDDRKNYVILREQRTFALLNRYPYTSGHLMIAPYAHVATLEQADPRDLEELIRLARRAEKALRAIYSPGGFNLGFNIGHCAGPG